MVILLIRGGLELNMNYIFKNIPIKYMYRAPVVFLKVSFGRYKYLTGLCPVRSFD